MHSPRRLAGNDFCFCASGGECPPVAEGLLEWLGKLSSRREGTPGKTKLSFADVLVGIVSFEAEKGARGEPFSLGATRSVWVDGAGGDPLTLRVADLGRIVSVTLTWAPVKVIDSPDTCAGGDPFS